MKVRLVRWIEGRDEWRTEHATGRVISNTDTAWTLDVGGAETVFDKNTWSIYRS